MSPENFSYKTPPWYYIFWSACFLQHFTRRSKTQKNIKMNSATWGIPLMTSFDSSPKFCFKNGWEHEFWKLQAQLKLVKHYRYIFTYFLKLSTPFMGILFLQFLAGNRTQILEPLSINWPQTFDTMLRSKDYYRIRGHQVSWRRRHKGSLSTISTNFGRHLWSSTAPWGRGRGNNFFLSVSKSPFFSSFMIPIFFRSSFLFVFSRICWLNCPYYAYYAGDAS